VVEVVRSYISTYLHMRYADVWGGRGRVMTRSWVAGVPSAWGNIHKQSGAV